MRAHLISLAGLCLLTACGGGEAGGTAAVDRAGPDFDFMNEVMQTRAEVIWNSAGYIVTLEGERDLSPTTDEGWAEVAAGAEAIKQAGEDLKTAAWAYDGENWNAFADGVVAAGERARLGAEAHSSDEMFEAGAQLYRVCVACHQFYRAGEFAEAE